MNRAQRRSKRKPQSRRPVPPLTPKARNATYITADLCIIRGRYCKVLRPEESKLALWSVSRQEVVFKCDTMLDVAMLSAKCERFDTMAATITRQNPPGESEQTSCTDGQDPAPCTQSHTPGELPSHSPCPHSTHTEQRSTGSGE